MADMRYMDKLDEVCRRAVDLIRSKTVTYGDSWKRRGGRGAWFTLVRPWDRLEKIVESHGGDIFAAVSADPSGADGSALACVRDLMNYLILVEAHCWAVASQHPGERVDPLAHMPRLQLALRGLQSPAVKDAVDRAALALRQRRLRDFGYRVSSWRVPDNDSIDLVRWMFAAPGQGYPVGIDSWPHETADAAWNAAWDHLCASMDEGTRAVAHAGRPVSTYDLPPEGTIIKYDHLHFPGTPDDGGHHARQPEGDEE